MFCGRNPGKIGVWAKTFQRTEQRIFSSEQRILSPEQRIRGALPAGKRFGLGVDREALASRGCRSSETASSSRKRREAGWLQRAFSPSTTAFITGGRTAFPISREIVPVLRLTTMLRCGWGVHAVVDRFLRACIASKAGAGQDRAWMDGGVDFPIYAGVPTVRVLVVKVSEDFGAEAEPSRK
jgi:hypothetical protein